MRFLKESERFSFKLGGKEVQKGDYIAECTESENGLATTYRFKNGLIVTNVAKKYDKFGAYEWVNYFENTSDRPTEIISELWDCNAEFPLPYEENLDRGSAYFPDLKECTRLYAPVGSTWSKKEFFHDANAMNDRAWETAIFPGETKKYATSGGRSSQARAPFFHIRKGNAGIFAAVGWSGQWNAEITRTNDGAIIRSKVEDTRFSVLPGEKFRTSSVVILPYTGKDEIDAYNLWRRFVKEEISPIGAGERDKCLPLCASIWGGMKSESILRRVEKIKENDFPFDYMWIDAGWYGEDTKPTPNEFAGDWGNHTGDWRVSPLCHPNGLKDVSEAIHDAGMKFLLWFEPERVICTTKIAKEHPEYFLRKDDKNAADCTWSWLLDLGNESALKYCFDTVSEMVERLRIDCYRQDFNIDPLRFWRAADEDDRQGITEIKYINGLYRLWDKLLEKFPRLLIDNCASGGRRIDIETMKRSVPLWRSDLQCAANYEVEGSQTHNQTFNLWLPYSGTGSGRLYDEYRIRSAYAAGLTMNYFGDDSFCDTAEKTAFVKKYAREYLRVRPYFSEDYYPLTEVTDTLDSWCAMRFEKREKKEGVIEVYRRENSPYETACFPMKNADVNAEYLFEDADGGDFKVSGRELAERGFSVTVLEKRKAKIYFYKVV